MKDHRIIVATGNAHKTDEIADALKRAGLSMQVVSAKAVGGMPTVDETGDTFADNARLKAEALRCKANDNDLVLADDSGLEVDALHGQPGVYSARYAGPNATDADNNRKLLAALGDLSPDQRNARFVCCLVLLGSNIDLTFNGVCPGSILFSPKGESGFGYDPLFVPDGYSETFAELGGAVKERISHRARACQELADWLLSRDK